MPNRVVHQWSEFYKYVLAPLAAIATIVTFVLVYGWKESRGPSPAPLNPPAGIVPTPVVPTPVSPTKPAIDPGAGSAVRPGEEEARRQAAVEAEKQAAERARLAEASRQLAREEEARRQAGIEAEKRAAERARLAEASRQLAREEEARRQAAVEAEKQAAERARLAEASRQAAREEEARRQANLGTQTAYVSRSLRVEAVDVKRFAGELEVVLLFTNLSNGPTAWGAGYTSRAITDRGYQYGFRTSFKDATQLLPGVPVRISYTFTGSDPSARRVTVILTQSSVYRPEPDIVVRNIPLP